MYLPLLSLLLLASCLTHQAFGRGRGRSPPEGSSDPSSRITVVGVVYCDTCSIKTFSRQSYFLQGVEVHVSCRFKASSPKTAEEVNISVNRTTNRSGVYKLEIPHVDGIDCVDGIAIASQCSAKLLTTSDDNAGCNVPVFRTASNEVSVKSKQDRVCIYSLSALSYKPSHKNTTLCGGGGGGGGKKHHRRVRVEEEEEKKLRDSKFFWPYLPPYWFPWPYPNLPPLPTLPPLPSLPFPFLPFGNPNPALPAFDWRNPITWIPYLPRFPPGDSNP
ncbi:hypothetical protein EUTSA_v10014366mg [Eutrema salsugineum]|uniref:Pollen Ole e 1 allergen and extensin family protein n=1 Tax=Eutrema salsugineum TaxID=72664 RepID=V4KTH6_EUTSA|nr:uncharacterized protein LOC18016757 [Eutrema salsugineum]ESQ41255.1 hypothetical protein EUTSA_v10014366mg [Eutrema salsugineum]